VTSPTASVGDVHVDIHPDASGFAARLRTAVLPAATKIGAEIGAAIGRSIQSSIVEGIRDGLSSSDGVAKTQGAALGATFGSAFARAAKTAIAAGLRDIASPRIDVDTTAAQASIRKLRSDLAALSGVTITIKAAVTGLADVRRMTTALTALRAAATAPIDVDINANVTAPLDDIRKLTRDLRALRALAATPIDIDVNVNVAAALADIRTLARDLRSINRMGAIDVTIQVNIRPPGVTAELIALHGIISRFRRLSATANVGVNTGNARAGIQALIAAGIAIGPAIVPAAAAAAAAIGAIGPAAFAAAAGIGVGILAFQGVGDAVKALGASQSKAAKTGATYAQQANQIASAQNQVRSAIAGVAAAERNLGNAQRDALRAQQAINDAREEARDALEDLGSQVANNNLSIRQANLDLADAEKALHAVRNLPVDSRQRVEAQLAYDNAKQSLDDLTTRQGRLAEEQQKATKAGIDGSVQVQAAQERARDTQERVLDAERALTEARQQVLSSQRDLALAYKTTGATGGAALDSLREKMSALSPAGQKFALFLHSLRGSFKQIKAAAEAGIFPGLQAGMEAMLPVLPQIVVFVSRVASAMGRLFEAAGKALASPFWQNFFDVMGRAAGPLLDALGGTIGGLAKGFASLLVAFTPFSIQFTQGMAGMAQAFAKWAAGLSESEGFQGFLAYVRETGPKVLTVLGGLTEFLIRLGVALAPLGALILDGLISFFTWINRQDPAVILAIGAAVGALFAAFAGGPVAVAVALTFLAGLFVNLYHRFEGFRRVVDTVFAAARLAVTTFVDAFRRGGTDVENTGFLGAIERVGLQARQIFDVLKAGVLSFVAAFKEGGSEVQRGGFNAYMANLGMITRQVFDWLKTTGIPALASFLDWVGPKASAAVAVAGTALGAFFAALNTLAWIVRYVVGPAVMWLWHTVIEPAWAGIRIAVDVAWAAIQVVFGLMQIAIKLLGGTFLALLTRYIKPAWDGIRPVFEAFGDFIGKHVAPKFASSVDGLGSIWNRLKGMASAPIKFIIGTVLNDGLLAAYNWIAKKFAVKPDNVQVPMPSFADNTAAPAARNRSTGFQEFAAGGHVRGAGTGTSDSIMARLSNGEYVIPAAIVRQFGVGFFDWLIGKQGRSKTTKPGDGSEGLAFAEGGLVGWLKGAWQGLTDPLGALAARINTMLGGMPATDWMRSVFGGPVKAVAAGVVKWAKEKIANLTTHDGYAGPISADVAAVRNWVARQAGKPYVWAAAGPDGFDCSGLVSNAYARLTGRNPTARLFSTHTMDNYFTKKGVVGPLTAGWSHAGERQGGSVGHTAASIAGLPFESRGSRGVIVGNDAVPYNAFARWGTFDSGGALPPGLTLAYNGTGKTEWINTAEQQAALVGAASGGDRALVSVGTMHVTNTTPGDIATELLWQYKTRG
jgi:hypothetical protein